MSAPHMGCTVDQPSGMQVEAVSELSCETPWSNKILSPEVPWDESRNYEGGEKHELRV